MRLGYHKIIYVWSTICSWRESKSNTFIFSKKFHNLFRNIDKLPLVAKYSTEFFKWRLRKPLFNETKFVEIPPATLMTLQMFSYKNVWRPTALFPKVVKKCWTKKNRFCIIFKKHRFLCSIRKTKFRELPVSKFQIAVTSLGGHLRTVKMIFIILLWQL